MRNLKAALALTCAIFIISFKAQSTERDYELKITKGLKANEYLITYRLFNFLNHTTVQNSRKYSEIYLKNSSALSEKSFPALPKISRDIGLPLDTNKLSFEIIDIKTKDLALAPPLPSRGSLHRHEDVSKIPYVEGSIYSSRSVYPKNWIEISKLFQLRDLKVSNISIFPFRYHFKDQKLEYIEELTFKVAFHSPIEGQGRRDFFSGHIDTSFLSLYKHHLFNFQDSLLPEYLENSNAIFDSGRMLIVSPPLFNEDLEEFVNWKRTRGFVVFSETWNQSQNWEHLRDLIKSYFAKEKISYVILVGDANLVPYRPGLSGNAYRKEADPLYALVAGEDHYPDLFISRISVQTRQELRTYLNKAISYEREPDRNSDWYSKALGIASQEGSWSGLRDLDRMDILRELLLAWDYNLVDQVYEPEDKSSSVMDALNEGRGFINYIGHGWEQGWVTSNFTNNNVFSLRNFQRWPFIVSVACVNGRFAYSYGDSFAEAWLKAGTEKEPAGAIGIFASSTNQSWVPPTVGQKRISELLTREVYNTMGSLFFHGSIAVLEDADRTAKQTFETWHIFGDASLQVRTRKPKPIRPEYLRISRLKEKSWLLHLNASPFISFSLKKNDQFITQGSTNHFGSAYHVFQSDEIKHGDRIVLNLTGFNRIPFQQELFVTD